MSRTAVIVVHYGPATNTERCLADLAQSRPLAPVFLVDNAVNAKGLASALRLHPAVKLIEPRTNVGFGRGCNLGIRAAFASTDCDFVLLLNNDARIAPETISQLESEMDKHADAGMVVPRIVVAERKNTLWYGGGHIDWRKGSARTPGYLKEADSATSTASREVTFATACALLIRREALEQIGGFDPRMFLYEEDVDLSLRMSSAGWRIWYAGHVVVHHRCQGSLRDADAPLVDMDSYDNPNLAFYLRHRIRNTVLNMLKHATGSRALLFWTLFPALTIRKCIRLAFHKRWDGVLGLLSGVREGFVASTTPFVNELMPESQPGQARCADK